jgi:hypothetical protein
VCGTLCGYIFRTATYRDYIHPLQIWNSSPPLISWRYQRFYQNNRLNKKPIKHLKHKTCLLDTNIYFIPYSKHIQTPFQRQKKIHCLAKHNRCFFSEKLHDLYFSRNIIRVIKSRMGGACSACGGEERCIQGTGGETPR